MRNRREVREHNRKFANAKVIELKNVPSSGISSALAANSTLSTEQLTVFVVGKHTLSVGLGEVEIVGDLHVLPSTMASARFGAGGGSGINIRTAGENGRAQPVLYAKRIKYTKRKGQLTLEPMDIEAIKRFASHPNLIPRLVSMMCPQYYGEDNAKLSLLLTSARARCPY